MPAQVRQQYHKVQPTENLHIHAKPTHLSPCICRNSLVQQMRRYLAVRNSSSAVCSVRLAAPRGPQRLNLPSA